MQLPAEMNSLFHVIVVKPIYRCWEERAGQAKINILKDIVTRTKLGNYSITDSLKFKHAKFHYSGRPITKENELLT